MFWNKKKNEDSVPKSMDPDSYAKLLNRITDRDAEVSTLKSKVANLEADMVLLRGKLSAKLRDLQKEYRDAEAEEDKKDELLYR